MRTLRFSLNGFGASVTLPDEFFDERGVPRWHLLNNRFSAPIITWNRIIGGVPNDEPEPTQEVPTLSEELSQLRAVVDSLERKFS